MYDWNPWAAGANAAAAAPPDSGIADPMRTVPSIGALARSGSEQLLVSTVQPPDGLAVVAWAAPAATAEPAMAHTPTSAVTRAERLLMDLPL